jgi:hypothetical protein
MQIIRRLVILAVVLVLLVIGALLLLIQPGGSGVLAALRLPDGSEYMVTQRCNWSPEPYTVAFYMRSSGGPWGWCYIHHEAMRWRNVTMKHDPNTDVITLTENGTWRASLNRQRGTFALGEVTPKRSCPHRSPSGSRSSPFLPDSSESTDTRNNDAPFLLGDRAAELYTLDRFTRHELDEEHSHPVSSFARCLTSPHCSGYGRRTS